MLCWGLVKDINLKVRAKGNITKCRITMLSLILSGSRRTTWNRRNGWLARKWGRSLTDNEVAAFPDISFNFYSVSGFLNVLYTFQYRD